MKATADPRTGIGKELTDFARELEDAGIYTDAVLVSIAHKASASRSSIYKWMSGEHECRNALTAKAIRAEIARYRKKHL